MLGRKRREFSRTTAVDASLERVWEALESWEAMYWLVTGCVLALPVPDRAAGLGAVACCWQLQSNGSLGALVHEVVEFEPGRLISWSERQRPQSDIRMRFRLDARSEGTHVEITRFESLYRYEWGQRVEGVTEQYLNRVAEGLQLAVANQVPGPHDVATLVLLPNAPAPQAVHEIEIVASPDDVWRLAEDEAGLLLASPDLERQWFYQQGGRELQVQLIRRPDDGLSCAFQQILRPEPHRVIVRGRSVEVDQQLVVHPNAVLLRATYRWDPNAVSAATIADSAQRWLAAVKAAAEGAGRPAS